MERGDYQKLIKSKDVLDYVTLQVTLEELQKLGDTRLAVQLERIMRDNRIEKPREHNKRDDKATDYYTIYLDLDEISTIVSMFADKEAGSLGPNYETTRAASFYATLLDNWNRIILD
jgi:hypothetical protein